MAPFLSSNSYLGLVQEATYSGSTTTAARGSVPTTAPQTAALQWIPVDTPQVTPQQTVLRDEALRGAAEQVYDIVMGVRHDEVDFKTWLYADSFHLLATGILGGNDVKAGSSPYTHTISNYYKPSVGCQPLSFSILDFDGANYFTMTGAQMSELNLAFGADKAAEVTTKFFANPYTASTSAPTGNALSGAPSYTAGISEHAIPSWNAAITIGGTSVTWITEGTLKIDRKTAPIFTAGQQAPYVNFAAPVEVSGSLTMVVATNADPFSIGGSAYGFNRNQVAQVITLTDATTSHSVKFQTSKTQYFNVKRSVGKAYTEITSDFTAVANSTDESGDTATSLSSILITSTNAVSGAYQLGY